jgi:hypothetical protein
MSTPTFARRAVPRGLTGVLAVMTLAGIAGFVVTAMLGFEEANTSLLWLSGALALAAPIAALMHLIITRKLTHDEKRIWLREFGGAELWSALSEYLSSTNLSESANRRATKRARRP